MYDDILLPTDGSSGTVEALEHALATAAAHDATVHVLYVVDRRHYMAAPDETKDEIRNSLEEEAKRALGDARVRIQDEGIECVTERIEGIPHREIVEYASEHADLIVVGTHGKTGRKQAERLGSTTDRVVTRSEMPTLVVDIGDEG